MQCLTIGSCIICSLHSVFFSHLHICLNAFPSLLNIFLFVQFPAWHAYSQTTQFLVDSPFSFSKCHFLGEASQIAITYVKYFHFIFASSTNFFFIALMANLKLLHLFFFFACLCLLLALGYFKKYVCVYSAPRYHSIISLVGNPGLKKKKKLSS